MPDLVEWLETAISEREAAAQNAGGMRWVTSVPGMVHVDPKQQADDYFAYHRQGYVATVESPAHGEHLRLNDPDAVLRRCAADRALIAEIQKWDHQSEPSDPHYSCWAADHPGESCDCGLDDRRGQVLRLLAEGYGYQEVAVHG